MIFSRQFVDILLIRIHLTFSLFCVRNLTIILEFSSFFCSFLLSTNIGMATYLSNFFPFLLICPSFYVPLDTFLELFCHHGTYFCFFFFFLKRDYELYTNSFPLFFCCNIKRKKPLFFFLFCHFFCRCFIVISWTLNWRRFYSRQWHYSMA